MLFVRRGCISFQVFCTQLSKNEKFYIGERNGNSLRKGIFFESLCGQAQHIKCVWLFNLIITTCILSDILTGSVPNATG